MTEDCSPYQTRQRLLSRRTILQTTAALGIGTTIGSASVNAESHEGGDLVWEFETGGAVNSSPSIVGGTVYVGSGDNHIYALDATTGEEEWAFETGAPIDTSPSVVGGTVFFASLDGTLYAIDATQGTERWSHWFEDRSSFRQVVSTVYNGKVYADGRNNHLYALNATTGMTDWRFAYADPEDSKHSISRSPTTTDGTVFAGINPTEGLGYLHALDAGNGEQKWRFAVPGGGVASAPTVADNAVFFGTFDNTFYAVDADTGDQIWEAFVPGWVQSSPTVAQGTVFVGVQNGGDPPNVFAFDMETGELEWIFNTNHTVTFSSPTVVGDLLFIGGQRETAGQNGFVYALNVNSGEEVWRFETGDSIWSSPTVVDGVVYIGSFDGSVYALNAGVDGVSEGTRVSLGTLGHHHVWAEQGLPEPPATGTVSGTIEGVNPDSDGSSIELRIFRDDETVAAIITTPDPDGSYEVELPAGETYELVAYDSGYEFDRTRLSVDQNATHSTNFEFASQAWSSSLGFTIQSSPTVVDGAVFIGSSRNVYALDVEDGSTRWSFTTGDGEGVVSSPAVVGERVFVGGAGGRVYALDRTDGSKFWEYDIGRTVRSSPTVADNTVYVGSNDGGVYALDAVIGSKRWHFNTDGRIDSSPTVVDGTVYVGDAAGTVYAIDGEDGTELWRSKGDRSDRVGSATVADGRVYIGGHNGAVFALDPADGTELWQYETEGGSVSATTVAEGTLYVRDSEGIVYALDSADGTEQRRYETLLGSSEYPSSPTVVDDTIYVGSRLGWVFAMDQDGTIRALFRIEDRYEGFARVSSPTVVDGILYIGGADGAVYAIRTDSDGDSEDSRVTLGTLGHHHVWADQDPLESVPSGTITGTVSDRADEPVADVAISVFNSGETLPTATARSAENGEYSLGVPSDETYEITARKRGFKSSRESITVETGESYSINFDVESPRWGFRANAPVNSSPTIIDETVYIGSDDGNVYALSVVDGTEQWQFQTNDGVFSSPMVVDGAVYVGSFDGNIYHLNAEDGTEQWQFQTDGRVYSSPLVTDDTLYVASSDGNVYALATTDGTEQWTFEIGTQIFSSPTVSDDSVYIGSANGSVYALSAEDGTEEWRFETGNSVVSSPTVVDNMVYIGSGGPDSNNGTVYALDAEAGTEQWSFQTNGGVQSSPTVSGSTVYINSVGGILYALDTVDGTERWGFQAGGRGFSSPTVASDTVFVGAGSSMYAVSADGGNERWSFRANSTLNSSPTVQDGTIYFASRDNIVFAVDTNLDGSSSGSRVELGTLGHHHVWPSKVTNQPLPEANFSAEPSDPEIGTAVEFDASASNDPDGSITSYEWEFGNGETTTGVDPTHTYQEPGSYEATLTIVDESGNEATEVKTILVSDETPPTADAGPNKTAEVGETVTLDGSGSSDNVGIASYEWDLDNGEVVSGEEATYTYQQPGSYEITLTVVDESENEDTDTMIITVESADSGQTEPTGTQTQSTGTQTQSAENGQTNTEEPPSQESPGFGVGTALTAIGGTAYLLKRRLIGDDET